MLIAIVQAPIYIDKVDKGEDALVLQGVTDLAQIWSSLIDKIKDTEGLRRP